MSNSNDDGAFLRIINFPTRGIGNRTVEQIRDAAEKGGTSLWHAACSTPLGGRAASAVSAFVSLMENIKNQTASLSLPDAIEHLIESSGLIAHYQKEREGQDRIENLNELVTAAAAFVSENEISEDVLNDRQSEFEPERSDDPLTEFLAHASLEAGDNQANAGEDALQLMTIHAAKGLEFHSVFISGLEEGLFPHENSINENGGLEEERRLMYVAMTRAMRRLYLSHSQMRMLHGQTRYNIESRFIDEIPEKLLKRLNVAKQQAAYVAPRAQVNVNSTQSVGGFKIGQQVSHSKFGLGVIVQAEGRGNDARLQVNFRDAGIKWLALEYAKLTNA